MELAQQQQLVVEEERLCHEAEDCTHKEFEIDEEAPRQHKASLESLVAQSQGEGDVMLAEANGTGESVWQLYAV